MGNRVGSYAASTYRGEDAKGTIVGQGADDIVLLIDTSHFESFLLLLLQTG